MLVTNSDYYAMCSEIRGLRSGDVLAIDTETTGLKPWLDTEIRGVSLAWGDKTAYVPLSHPGGENIADRRELLAALTQTKALPVYHNAGYDFATLERGIGLAPPARFRDTQILSWLIDENGRHGLKPLGAHYFGEDERAEQNDLKALMKGETKAEAYKRLRAEGHSAAESRELSGPASAASKRTWADLTAEEIAPYAEQDASLTLRLYSRLIQDAEYARVEPAVERHHALQSVVYRMEKLGVAVDQNRIVVARHRNEVRIAAIEAQFDVSLASPKQLATLVYETWGLPIHERTDSGQPSTSREALEALAGAHEGLDLILEHRRLSKANSGYFGALLDNIDPEGRIHPSFNVTGTVTGRFSCSSPNLQTIPRDDTLPEVKAVFVPTPGYELWSFDLKQAELRFAASMSREQAMIDALTEGRDLYQETADALGTTRQIGKALVLSYQYGVGPRKFARNFVKGTGRLVTAADVRRAKDVLNGYAATYPDLAATMDRLSMYADSTGRLPLLQPGRFRRFVSPGAAYPVPSYTALNAICQGGVADFVGNVMIDLERPLSALGGRIVLQVHDSIVCELPPGAAPSAGLLIQTIGDGHNPLSMPLVWEAKAGL